MSVNSYHKNDIVHARFAHDHAHTALQKALKQVKSNDELKDVQHAMDKHLAQVDVLLSHKHTLN